MMVLKANQVCSFYQNCPYNNSSTSACQGANPDRKNQFICNYVDEKGVFSEGKFRSGLDQTGKMKVILEGDLK